MRNLGEVSAEIWFAHFCPRDSRNLLCKETREEIGFRERENHYRSVRDANKTAGARLLAMIMRRGTFREDNRGRLAHSITRTRNFVSAEQCEYSILPRERQSRYDRSRAHASKWCIEIRRIFVSRSARVRSRTISHVRRPVVCDRFTSRTRDVTFGDLACEGYNLHETGTERNLYVEMLEIREIP